VLKPSSKRDGVFGVTEDVEQLLLAFDHRDDVDLFTEQSLIADRLKNQTPNTPKTINAYFNRHAHSSS
jgi:hypothetical protein